MRQAADILSSAPAMQIRYLEAMQAMAKTSNSKVIFLPATNQMMPSSAAFDTAFKNSKGYSEEGEGENWAAKDVNLGEFRGQDPSFQQAMNARVIENV